MDSLAPVLESLSRTALSSYNTVKNTVASLEVPSPYEQQLQNLLGESQTEEQREHFRNAFEEVRANRKLHLIEAKRRLSRMRCKLHSFQ